RRRVSAAGGWPNRDVNGREAFAPPVDLSVEPLNWPASLDVSPGLDSRVYAPVSARRPAEPEAQPQGQPGRRAFEMYAPRRVISAAAAALKPGTRALKETQPSLLDRLSRQDYIFPPLHILAEPRRSTATRISKDALDQNARLLEGVLEDFGVKGQI